MNKLGTNYQLLNSSVVPGFFTVLNEFEKDLLQQAVVTSCNILINL